MFISGDSGSCCEEISQTTSKMWQPSNLLFFLGGDNALPDLPTLYFVVLIFFLLSLWGDKKVTRLSACCSRCKFFICLQSHQRRDSEAASTFFRSCALLISVSGVSYWNGFIPNSAGRLAPNGQCSRQTCPKNCNMWMNCLIWMNPETMDR